MTDDNKQKIDKLKEEKRALRKKLKDVEEKKTQRETKIESTAFMFAVIGNLLGLFIGWNYGSPAIGLFGGAIIGWYLGKAIASMDS